MNFTKMNIWLECENARKINKISASDLSKKLFSDKAPTLYATRKNIVDGGLRVPFSALQYFGATSMSIVGTNINTRIVLKDKTISSISTQLVDVLCLLVDKHHAYTCMPQTIYRAMNKKYNGAISLSTFEKAFSNFQDLSFTINYGNIIKDMEDLF